jgi:hypothetical protein
VGKVKKMILYKSIMDSVESSYKKGVLKNKEKLRLFGSLGNSEEILYHQGMLTGEKEEG